MRNGKIVFILMAFLLILTSCTKKPDKPKELLIYCGITLIQPIMEIKTIVEKEYDCNILVTKGGSGNLLTSLKLSKIGDLYLPGSESYIKQCYKEDLIADTVFVGCNRASIMVQKGNPKNISSDLNNFTNKDYAVVIGNPESGSIGKETKKILTKKGIYKQVLGNVLFLTTDSKDLFRVLKDKEADLVINWYAVSQWEENKDYVTAIKIDEKYANKKRLVIGSLKTSKYPEIAKRFMEIAGSKEGKEIFRKYGFGQ